MSLKRKRADEADGSDDDVFRSAPLEDRASTFIGLFSPSLKPQELQGLAEIKSASHKILGWRKESNQQSITKAKQYVTKSDDDGERYGGKRIEKVLHAQRVEGSLVIARWYGGTMLGPVRFEHMETVANEAIQRWREYGAKRRKMEEEQEEQARLVSALSDRDQSITVLRTLAIEKEEKLKQAKTTSDVSPDNTKEASQPKAPCSGAPATSLIDYGSMPIDRLKALDKARDATISFLLKRIDRAEAELSALDKSTKEPSESTAS